MGNKQHQCGCHEECVLCAIQHTQPMKCNVTQSAMYTQHAGRVQPALLVNGRGTVVNKRDWYRWVCTSGSISQGLRAIAHAICVAHSVTTTTARIGTAASKQPCIPQLPAPKKVAKSPHPKLFGMQPEAQRCCLSANRQRADRQRPRTRATMQFSALYEGICSNCKMVGATTSVPRLQAVRCHGALPQYLRWLSAVLLNPIACLSVVNNPGQCWTKELSCTSGSCDATV